MSAFFSYYLQWDAVNHNAFCYSKVIKVPINFA